MITVCGGTNRTTATRLICDLCPRHCALKPGDRGFCFVRENRDGQVVSTTYGRSTGFCIDPIEKKPLNHFYPGTPVLSFGTAGCNLGCKFCQNWTMSRSRDVEAACEEAQPEAIAAAARRLGCRSVAFTYNDPIIWAEYAIDTAKACHALGVKTVAVTSGYITDAARAAFYEQMDAANVDLKGFTDEFYRELLRRPLAAGARHAPLAGPREPDLGRNHQPDHPRGERFAGRDRADVPVDRRGAGARRAAAFLGLPSRLQADRPRADAAATFCGGPRHCPSGRLALRLHGQRLRPGAPAHLLPRLRPRGDPPRGLHDRDVRDQRRPLPPLPNARSPAVSTTPPAPGAAGGCR